MSNAMTHLYSLPQAPARALEALQQKYETSDHPVIVVAVAAAIVLGVGFIAFLTAMCISRGYSGFGAVVDITWTNPFSANVTFKCI
ncbi:hypothetical protein [Microbacterium foliorum]|uniref:hypothetical protein n=1 Tax=Microbacterium foliorum TaxID=104336 RepID=UPI0028D1D09D|nr:hypothetical protein [Microbacterium foliorum]